MNQITEDGVIQVTRHAIRILRQQVRWVGRHRGSHARQKQGRHEPDGGHAPIRPRGYGTAHKRRIRPAHACFTAPPSKNGRPIIAQPCSNARFAHLPGQGNQGEARKTRDWDASQILPKTHPALPPAIRGPGFVNNFPPCPFDTPDGAAILPPNNQQLWTRT